VDMEELEDDIEERLVGDAINDAEDDDSDNESVSSEESLDPEEQRLKDIRQSVSKLDTIMDLLFTHYDSVFAEDRFEADELFESLLSQFASTILPTYRSRHTQFLLFHFSQTSASRTEQFARIDHTFFVSLLLLILVLSLHVVHIFPQTLSGLSLIFYAITWRFCEPHMNQAVRVLTFDDTAHTMPSRKLYSTPSAFDGVISSSLPVVPHQRTKT
jgi:hypothetical protein